MEEKNIDYDYLFDDRELNGLENIEELSNEEIEKILTDDEKKELEQELEKETKNIKIKFEE